jgi:5-methyltetrahydropteroyltriglutamate--homocysteine methyltransferase
MVGSLLRPAELQAEVERVYGEGYNALMAPQRDKDLTRLHELEDKYVDQVVKKQLDIGLEVVTDGEFRRYMFTGPFFDSVESLEPSSEGMRFVDGQGGEYTTQALPVITTRLRKIDSPTLREVSYLKTLADGKFKITYPAASFLALPFNYLNGVTDQVYPSRAELVDDMIAIQREQIDEAIAAGLRYVQFDFPLYPFLVDEGTRQLFASLGLPADQLLEEFIAADQRMVEDLPDHVTRAMHICRGNWKSRHIVSGSLDSVAERIFNELPYDAFFVEWEDISREGGYETLRLVPPGKRIFLGVVSTKVADVEPAESLVSKVEAASRYIDVSQLGISTQCGFASTSTGGNDLDQDAQWRKLEEMVKAAEIIWAATPAAG